MKPATSSVILGLCVAGFSLAAGSAARAESAQATWTTYLYQGPGNHYSVTGEVPQATRFEVSRCADGWCEITYDKIRGFVRQEIVAKGDLANPAEGVLPQPAAAIVPNPSGPCFEAMQKGGNGGNMLTVFCAKKKQ